MSLAPGSPAMLSRRLPSAVCSTAAIRYPVADVTVGLFVVVGINAHSNPVEHRCSPSLGHSAPRTLVSPTRIRIIIRKPVITIFEDIVDEKPIDSIRSDAIHRLLALSQVNTKPCSPRRVWNLLVEVYSLPHPVPLARKPC